MEKNRKNLFKQIQKYLMKYPTESYKFISEKMVENEDNCGYAAKSIQTFYFREALIADREFYLKLLAAKDEARKGWKRPPMSEAGYGLGPTKTEAARLAKLREEESQEDPSEGEWPGDTDETSPLDDPSEVRDTPVEMYTMSFGENTFVLPRKTIELIHAAYTREGANLTKHQTIKALDIDKKDFRAVKNYFDLTKDSFPYPHGFIPSGDVNSAVSSLVGEVLDKFKSNDPASVTGAIRQVKKDLFNLEQVKKEIRGIHEEMLKELRESKHASLDKIPSVDASDEITVIIGDMHLGMRGKWFSFEKAMDMAKQMLAHIRNQEASRVNVIFLGDILHTVTGTNHPNTWQDLTEEDGYGGRAIIRSARLLITVLSMIENLGDVSIVGGNHDRLTSNNNEDQDDGGAMVIADMLRLAFPNISITFDPAHTTLDTKMIRFVNFHGDLRNDKLPAKDKFIKYGHSEKFNLFNIGHLHHLNAGGKEQGDKYMQVYWPAFCPPDKYSDRGGYENAFSGFGIVRSIGDRPMISIYPLLYK